MQVALFDDVDAHNAGTTVMMTSMRVEGEAGMDHIRWSSLMASVTPHTAVREAWSIKKSACTL